MKRFLTSSLLLASASVSFGQVSIAPDRGVDVYETPDGQVVAADVTGTYVFNTWSDYHSSEFFEVNNMRCIARDVPGAVLPESVADCSNSNTNPSNTYAPSGETYVIPVVFHIFIANNGNGNIADQRVIEQVQILNDDFASLTNSNIQFVLAPGGINRYTSNSWYNDKGNYTSVRWDTTQYLNIYSNTAGGSLGYAYLPSGGGVAGTDFDGVRLFWRTVGYTNYSPYNLGRTGTHEVGHYLGLYHTFQGGCGSSNCYGSGDLICDTNPEGGPNYSACQPSQAISCGSQDPVRNYMDYSEDACMDNFTQEQARRMRCTLMNFRPTLSDGGGGGGGGGGGTPPGAASNPSPTDGASSVSIAQDLTWDAGSGATSNDVFFGTNPNPGAGEFQGNQGGTTFDPGTLAFSTTYYWRVDAVNGDGTTTGPIWSFTTEADGGGGGGGGGGELFSDDFESGNLSAGGWSAANSNASVGSPAFSGAYAARLRRTTSISKGIDTSAGGATLTFWARTVRYDSGERILAEYSTDGSSWTTGATVNPSNSYSQFTVSLPASSNLQIRFSTNANRNNEYGMVDDVLVQ